MATPEGMIELSVSDSWALLDAHSAHGVGRIAVAVMNHPDIFPVNYCVDGDGDDRSVLFRSAEGTKLAAAVLGTSVAFEIDGYDAVAGEAWSVVVKGEAAEVIPTPGDLRLDDLPLFPWHASPKHRVVRISPTEVSGRRFVVVSGRGPVG